MGSAKKTKRSEGALDADVGTASAPSSHAYHPGPEYSTVSTKPLMGLNDSQKEIWLLRLPLEVPLSALQGAKCKLKTGVDVGLMGSMTDTDGVQYELMADHRSLSSQLFAAAADKEGAVLKPHRIARHVSLLPALAGPSTPPPAGEPPATPNVTPARHTARAEAPADVEMTPRTPKTGKKRKSAEAELEAAAEGTPKLAKKHKEKKEGKDKSHRKKEKSAKKSEKSDKKKKKIDKH